MTLAIASSTLLYNSFTTPSTTTFCEGSNKSTTSNNNNNEEEYDDKDEPTTCTICLINRQGPCKKHWRTFERCMKESAKKSEEKDENEIESSSNSNSSSRSSSSSSSSSSMSEKCDQFMIPWITCVQQHRNLYTYISNKVFQDQYLSAVEDSIPDTPQHRVHLDGLDLSEFVTMGIGLDHLTKEEKENKEDEGGDSKDGTKEEKEQKKDWYSVMMGKDGSNQNVKTKIQDIQEDDEDFILVENSIKINLYDFQNSNKDSSSNNDDDTTTTTQTALPITIAYVKDQDGNLLGYEEFNDWKKARRVKQEEESSTSTDESNSSDTTTNSSSKEQEDENSQKGADDAPRGVSASATVGQCLFSMIPQKTTAIQFFALYESDVPPTQIGSSSNSKDDNSDQGSTDEKKIDSNVGEGEESSSNASSKISARQRLYYSSLIPLDQIPHESSSP